jgi:hypothetical protein
LDFSGDFVEYLCVKYRGQVQFGTDGHRYNRGILPGRTMKLMIVADSHGRDLQSIIKRLEPDWNILVIWLGQKTSLLRQYYDGRLSEILAYNPDSIVLHSGHNDVAFHVRYNCEPIGIVELLPEVMDFKGYLQVNHPSATIYWSSLFPRTQAGNFNMEQTGIYNRKAKRYMESLRSASNSENFGRLLNQVLWKSIKKCVEDPKYFDGGGLHLNATGKESICVAWIAELKAFQ